MSNCHIYGRSKVETLANRPKINNLFNSIKSRTSVIDTYISHLE
ncbi:MAG: hypothetical protein ACKVKE_04275 [Candidatus Pelagibacterales bacterium]